MRKKLLFLCTDISKNVNRIDNFPEKLSLLGSCVFDHLAECYSVQTIKSSWRSYFYCSSSWSVIHQSQFTESVTVLVNLKEFVLTIDDFPALVFTRLNDEKGVSVLAFLDDCLIFSCLSFFHGVD